MHKLLQGIYNLFVKVNLITFRTIQIRFNRKRYERYHKKYVKNCFKDV